MPAAVAHAILSSSWSDESLGYLKAVCLMTGAALHLAPIPTMREITAARSTLNYHIAPYASIFLNHSVNLWYAVIRGDNALIAHRIAGCIAQSSYLSTYLWNSAPIKAADNKKWLQWVLGILVGIFFHLHGVLPLLGANSQYMTHIAFLGAVTGVGLAASPLATVREVLRNKDASSLPPLLCSMVTLQCFSWGVYGWVRNDWSTLINNVVGVVLGSIQLTLIALYGNKRGAHAHGNGTPAAEAKSINGEDAGLIQEAAGEAVVLDSIAVERSPKTGAAASFSESKQR